MIVGCLAVSLLFAQPSLAEAMVPPDGGSVYSGSAAGIYANVWALSRNTGTYPAYGNDCANFVSQALRAGGWHFTNMYDTDDTAWWYAQADRSHPMTWSVARNMERYMTVTPYSDRIATWGPSSALSAWTPNAVKTGDVVFYDWTGDGNWDHVSMQTGYGTDARGRYGNWISQHTTDRLRVFWSLYDFNSNRALTKYRFYHIFN